MRSVLYAYPVIIWTVYRLRGSDGRPLSRDFVRQRPVQGTLVLRSLISKGDRVARLEDERGHDVIPALRRPVLHRAEAHGIMLIGQAAADGLAAYAPQVWWCEPASESNKGGLGWARWYQWRRPVSSRGPCEIGPSIGGDPDAHE